MTVDVFDLDRFLKAQAPVLMQVRSELHEGRKRSHWMWFIFPQLAGLGHSFNARHYAIASLKEASAYLAHAVLGPRLIECTALVNGVTNKSVHQIFGSPDDLKFHSCMTLFAQVQPTETVFSQALEKYFRGSLDRLTMETMGTF